MHGIVLPAHNDKRMRVGGLGVRVVCGIMQGYLLKICSHAWFQVHGIRGIGPPIRYASKH